AATLSFSQSVLSLNPTTDTAENVVFDAGTSKVGFAKVTFTFDKSKIVLSKEIVPTTTLKKVISVTTMAQANSSGQVTIVLGLDPADINNAPTGAFTLANLSFKAANSTASSSSIAFVTSSSQIVDMTATPFTCQQITQLQMLMAEQLLQLQHQLRYQLPLLH